jgi:Xaa-Pro dipeptidase
VDVYPDYPGQEHPMEHVGRALAGAGAERIGADHDGHVPIWGYRGPRLSDIIGRPPIDAEMLIESLRRVKSPAELDCIQLSCDWAARAHRRMQDEIVTGRTEMECYSASAQRTLAEMVHEMPGWGPVGFAGTGLTAMFDAGRGTAIPHGFVQGHGIQKGDVLVSWTAADIDGYQSELERTMIVGEPTP